MCYWLVFNDLQGNSSSTYVFIANGFSIKMCLNREMKFKLLFSNLQKSNFWQRNCKSVLRIYCNTLTNKTCRHDIIQWTDLLRSAQFSWLGISYFVPIYLFICKFYLFFYFTHTHFWSNKVSSLSYSIFFVCDKQTKQ